MRKKKFFKMQFKDNVKVEVNNNLAVITLCRPEKKNAINSTMYENITIALDKLSENKEVAITVITGTGDYYCSGTDLQDGLSNTLGSIDEAIKQASCRLR